ncbi:MAG: hypothetical protein IJW72_00255 [Alphaproteobacteria bacterium]|nr:hypothetical protein [Alphaproteobacteria bacterium]
MDKEGFIIYKSFYEPIKELSLDHKGLLLSAIFEYQINKKVIDLPIECRMAFKFFKNQFDLDEKKYTKICEKRAEAGRKSAERKLKEMLTNADKCQQKQQMLTKATDKDKDKDKEKEKDKDKDKEKDKDLNTDNLNNNNLNNITDIKNSVSKKLNESEVVQCSVDFGKQILIGENFKINFEDELFFPYRLASSFLAKSVEDWIIKNKLGCRVDKNFICKQIVNFAKKQGKYNELLGTDKL